MVQRLQRNSGKLYVDPERPALFKGGPIREPPAEKLHAPISDYEFRMIDRYVHRAHNLKEALIQFDEALLEQWEDYLQYHRENRLNQNVFAGPHGAAVTESSLATVIALSSRLDELKLHHDELKCQVAVLEARLAQ